MNTKGPGRPVKLTPKKIQLVHALLLPDAPVSDIHALADLMEFSYSTIWHVVRGYGRDDDAPWRAWDEREEPET